MLEEEDMQDHHQKNSHRMLNAQKAPDLCRIIGIFVEFFPQKEENKNISQRGRTPG